MEHLDNTEIHEDENPEDARDTQSHNNIDNTDNEEDDLRDMEDYLNFRKYGIVPPCLRKYRETLRAQCHGGDDGDEAGNLEDREDHSMNNQETETLEAGTEVGHQSSRRHPPGRERMPSEFTAAYPHTLNNIGMSRRKRMAMLRDMQNHMKRAVQVQALENRDVVIWTSTLKRKIMDHPETIYCVVPMLGAEKQRIIHIRHQPLPGARRIRYLEHQGEILHLAATFQNIAFETMSQEGEEA